MKIVYKSKAVMKQFSSKYRSGWRYPRPVIEKLLAAETFIKAAASLKDVASYPPFHFHLLIGDRAGEWSIYLGKTGYRVTMIPCADDESELLSGDIMAQCSVVKIVKITEVSNHYE